MNILVYFFYFWCIFQYFPLMENLFDHMFMLFLFCRRGNKHFDIHFPLIRPVNFPSKDGKDAVCKEEMEGNLFISRQSRHISFVINMIKVLFPYFVPLLGV